MPKKNKIILGIESSCDETACAIVNDKKEILASVVWSQYDEHRRFGGVVPEIAARAHLEKCDVLIKKCMEQAGVSFSDLSAVAVAAGPGLIGGVLVGVMTAKTLAFAHNLPFIAVNHLEGHALVARLTSPIQFPYLLLLTSGGHCQLLEVMGVGQYKKLGATIDDSAGEAFDKVAKMLDIGYPGGPNLEKRAALGNPKAFKLPVPMKGRAGCDFSFSGLKTAVRVQIERLGTLSDTQKNDMCASFQSAVLVQMKDRVEHAIKTFHSDFPKAKDLVVGGGVAANQSVRAMLEQLAIKHHMCFSAPPMKHCTDNGVMIAWAGLERFQQGLVDNLDFKARPRWPLEELHFKKKT
ncbi:MAG: tRNA (adenosine(37)-N6)-threonylcarbamoyltransferase complex transferase subunit TsaD [Alphaproteobacteria bacterium]|nr:tRNA (adenosine(37)-N6)-threonylcarbamoyltransferase complex transferase subunit TsaD [Alphaproteobacteria bacterium]